MNLSLTDNEIKAGRIGGPFFSIIVTTFNRAALLKRALDSIISQSETDWEVIIVDDESTDNTYDEIIPYLREYKSIRYYRKSHSGEALTKNTGIAYAGGKYVTFLDSDDEYSPDHLRSRKSILLRHPSVSFLHGGTFILGNQQVPDRFNPGRLVNLSDCVIGGTFFIERITLLRLKGFRNIELGTDADLFERARIHGVSIMKTYIPTYIYHHENNDSITNKMISQTPGNFTGHSGTSDENKLPVKNSLSGQQLQLPT